MAQDWRHPLLVYDEVYRHTSESIFSIRVTVFNYLNFFQGLVETPMTELFFVPKELFKNIT